MTLIKPAAAAVDPSMLSHQQRAALSLGAMPGLSLWRSRGRFGRPPQSVSLDVAGSLIALGLMRIERGGRNPQLVLTGNGRIVEAVLAERGRKRA